MGHAVIPYKWKEYLFHRGCSFNCTSILQSGLIAGGRASREGRQTVFFTPLNPFGDNPDEERPSDDFSKPREVHYHSKWKTIQDAVCWVNLARAQDKGLRFWQTRSNDVIVFNSVPVDCIYEVISQQGERTLFERLSTPRPAKKIGGTQECLAISAAATAAAECCFWHQETGSKRGTRYSNRLSKNYPALGN